MSDNVRTSALRVATTPVLDCAYEERGPSDGAVVMLVHGFPDAACTWDAIAEGLAADGFRVLVPHVRGFGATRIRDGATIGGETTALGRDTLDLADALGIETFAIVGHDWGARAAYVAAALAPDRLTSLAALAVGYGTNAAGQSLSIAQTQAYWYQWFFATPRGAAVLADDARAFCEALWRIWSPGLILSDAERARTASAWTNPQFVPVALHSYRERWGFAESDPRYAADRATVAGTRVLSLPTLVLMGADDGATLPESSLGKEAFFSGRYERRVVPNVGHFIQREAPELVLAALRAHLAGVS